MVKDFQEQVINIRDLVIEEPVRKPEGSFDPEREVSDFDWNKMLELLNQFRKEGWVMFSPHAADMKVILPNKVRDLNLDDEVYQALAAKVGMLRQSRKRVEWIQEMARIKRLFPEKIGPQDTSSMKDGLLEKLNEYYGWNWIPYTSLAVEMMIVYPELTEGIRGDEGVWQGVEGALATLSISGPKRYSTQLAEAKIINPEKFKELKIRDGFWEDLRIKLQDLREKGNYRSFAIKAAEASIISADDIQITENEGLVIVRQPKPPQFDKNIDLPTKRRF